VVRASLFGHPKPLTIETLISLHTEQKVGGVVEREKWMDLEFEMSKTFGVDRDEKDWRLFTTADDERQISRHYIFL
jgi:hypothetical protein